MDKKELIAQILNKKSFLCVGLDPDLSRIPSFLLELDDPVFEFNKRIIDATKEYCVAYKPNIAFYECLGPKGWLSLKKTIDYIPKNMFIIADAKRGDIGNSSLKYAETFFKTYDFDAITVAPYMGKDSVTPFLTISKKWVIVLGLTSNSGSSSFQQLVLKNGKKLFEEVLEKTASWGDDKNIMFVVGANNENQFSLIREKLPNHFLLVPGIGAQGGDLQKVIQQGINKDGGLIINSSRGIIYASKDEFFEERASEEARKLRDQMAVYI
jgi:orotidine-5'-phosphate decarboxylase